MNKTWSRPLIVFAAIVVCLFSSKKQASAEELTLATFQRLHRQLEPAPDQPWRTIPWKVALLDAQQTAATQHKPIFIWAMDGHPLGCT